MFFSDVYFDLLSFKRDVVVIAYSTVQIHAGH